MMSLGTRKEGVTPPNEEDRKKIIRQMKVRTTLKEDKSWIHAQNSDNEEEMKNSPLSPGSKPTSGYLIRGVFTRTIDKTPPKRTSYSNGTQKSAAAQAQSSSLPCVSSGYKMTTEDYKKLAEAANSVLRRTASRERSYVLSAAKKSNGSPTQEVSPFIAKRVEIEEEGGPHMQSQTLPASSRFSPGGKSTNGESKNPNESSWSKPKPMAADYTTSFDADSKSQATRLWNKSTSQIPSYTESSDKGDEEEPVGTSQREATLSKSTLATGRSHNPVKEEPDLIFWDESVPKATTISTGKSEKEERTLKPTVCDSISSEERSNLYFRDNTSDPVIETCHQYRGPEYMEDMNSNLTRSNSQSRDIFTHPTDTRFIAAGYLGDTECDPKRSVSGYEERSPTVDIESEGTRGTEHREPEWNAAKLSALEGITEHAEKNMSTTRAECPPTRKHTDLHLNRAQIDPDYEERPSTSGETSQESPQARRHKELDLNSASKGILFVKEYVNSRELSSTPHYSSGSLVDLSEKERASYSNASYLHSSAAPRSCEGVCTYCGREIRDCPKIMIEHLNVYCHEYCFRCGICHKAMGDLLDKIFIHRDIVHCDQCYEKLF
ncbi:zinc finger protein 185 isoform X3 [Pelodiscus sinensis]|uniref:zinc finger protein 185 isoform X3 n=1 Tax=Pelodiscus sinensis TaxID=13735 RepID=UPI003F6CF4C4